MMLWCLKMGAVIRQEFDLNAEGGIQLRSWQEEGSDGGLYQAGR